MAITNKNSKKNGWLVLLVIPAVLLLGALFVGVMAFNVTPALAQLAGGGAESPAETEGSADADDGAEGPDVPITKSALEQASAATLDYMGEGRVTETEVGDEEGYYEVEITLDNGRQVDVHLDQLFNVLGHEAD